jgi:hypothetical protein
MTRRTTCRIRDHDWRRRGDAEVCERCGTRFPCRDLNCGHVDCWIARGRRGKLPPMVSAVDGVPAPGRESDDA